ncbi:FxSxx-COOH system tetratricopeptide repeat protein [Asanoa ishikariensis]|uniref:FxSxx-COOH system tetratricopeptide repeat protein n=1 Tax=Asanoa ishikariensis TaxID=137265 RepID=UPI0015A2135C|nr:FxSxx-COOH system tetratricopeptide repeat protein [Asanoa ishikariensis]
MHRALIVCNSDYDADARTFHELRGPRHDGSALWHALTEPSAGLFSTVVPVFERKSQPIGLEAKRFFNSAARDDVVLFYFSGHGWLAESQLYLCGRDSTRDEIEATALSASTLDAMLEGCRARTKIVILDCCYSGAFKGDADPADRFAGRGRFVLASTPPTQLAKDAEHDGQLSPFTHALVEGLRGSAVDAHGKGFVDLDDLKGYLETALVTGPRPYFRWTGSGQVKIARREAAASIPAVAPAKPPADAVAPMPAPRSPGDEDPTFLDRTTAATWYDAKRVAEFRRELKDEIADVMPAQLSDAEFLTRARLLDGGKLTLAGALLFADLPTNALDTAIVRCSRIDGTDISDPLTKRVLRGTVIEQISAAHAFVADAARRGEVPTARSAQAEPVYDYPMIAMREIIANALVHRDYADRTGCVHIRVFTDRIEVSNPGPWTGQHLPPGESVALSLLRRESRHRNFRLADALTWLRYVEGEGAGIPRAVRDCAAAGAQEPTVTVSHSGVVVTVYKTPAPRGPETVADQPATVRSKALLVEALMELDSFRSPSARSTLFTELESSLGQPLPQQRSSSLRVDAVDLLGKLSRVPDGLSALVSVLHLLEGPTKSVRQIEELVRAPEPAQPATPRPARVRDDATDGQPPRQDADLVGREAELQQLEKGLEYGGKHLLYGPGWVGKSRLAAQFAQQSTTKIVWWIDAERVDAVEASLLALGRRLKLSPSHRSRPELMLNYLATDAPPWLLVYDNATRPGDLVDLIPEKGGKVIITSRDPEWIDHVPGFEVGTFTRQDSLALILQGWPKASDVEADRLAEALGDLPLALRQATGWHQATGMPVDEYLELLADDAAALLDEGLSRSYPGGLTSSVMAAKKHLGPPAAQLLNRLAHLGDGGITQSLLRAGSAGITTAPLATAISSAFTLNQMVGELCRSGLVRVDEASRVRVHRAVRAILCAINATTKTPLRETQRLLVAASPGTPWDHRAWDRHGILDEHVLPARLIDVKEDAGASAFVLDQIDYRQARGDHEAALHLAKDTAARWNHLFGPDDVRTLAASSRLSAAHRAVDGCGTAEELTRDAYERAVRHLGGTHSLTLALAAQTACDQRFNGDFRDAYSQDRLLVDAHVRQSADGTSTLVAMSAVGVDLRLLGEYQQALEWDQDLRARWAASDEPEGPRALAVTADIARDLIYLGRYSSALDMLNELAPKQREMLGRSHLQVLRTDRLRVIASRNAGHPEDRLLAMGGEMYSSHHARLGPDHEDSLAAAMIYAHLLTTITADRKALDIVRDTRMRYETGFGRHHPLTLAATANVRVIERSMGVDLVPDAEPMERLQDSLGAEHPYTLCAAHGLANDLFLAGRREEADELTEATRRRLAEKLGEQHPYTVAAAVNLSAGAVTQLTKVLGAGHSAVVGAKRGQRVELEIEPPPMTV